MLENSIQRPWLAKYDTDVPQHLVYEKIPIYEYLDRAAEWHPKHTAIIFNNWRTSYANLKSLSETFAANLKEQGLLPGDRVALMLPNTPQAIIAYWGVLKAGGVVVMTNPLYMEKELLHHFRDSGARFLIAIDLVWPKIIPLLDQVPLEKIFITRISDCLAFPLNLLYKWKAHRDGSAKDIPYDIKKIFTWGTLLRKGVVFQPIPLDPENDIALLQYTGGTTGISKGVMLTHQNLAANVQQIVAILHSLRNQQHIFLGLLPFFHIYGLTVNLNLATALSSTIVPFPRFSPLDVLKAIVKHKPNVFPSAPAVFMTLLQQKTIEEYDLSSIKLCVSGSAPIPVEIIERFKKMTGAEIVEGFGLTEASPVTHLNPVHGKRKFGSIGLPLPDTEACIVDMEVGSVPMPAGKIGELILRGPQVMKGYWNKADETANVLRNGWLYTGDIATMDDEGYFYIVDRKKDLIIAGGYNIYPREIDEVLHEHPKVKEAVAVGIPHPARGEVVKAYIVPNPGMELTKSEVIAFCRQKLANYKVPKEVEFREELPKTMVGKILRRVLRDEEIKKIQDAGRLKED